MREQNILGLKFKNEGMCAPEQYDVFDDFGVIAYVRYRYGKLWVDYPWVGGDAILYEELGGQYQGCFTDDDERETKLNEVAKTIIEYDNNKKLQSGYNELRELWNTKLSEFMKEHKLKL